MDASLILFRFHFFLLLSLPILLFFLLLSILLFSFLFLYLLLLVLVLLGGVIRVHVVNLCISLQLMRSASWSPWEGYTCCRPLPNGVCNHRELLHPEASGLVRPRGLFDLLVRQVVLDTVVGCVLASAGS